ncbi:MAG: sulfate transporter CysZ [Gammaproteobacteria bacterium]|nr:sulfate transporter CysZ [Gammaproteobacteria bacterium]
MRQLAAGANHLLKGFSLLNQPGVRLFVVIPFFINLCIYTALLVYSIDQFGLLMDWMVAQLPGWLGWLEWLLWPLFLLLTALLVAYTFTLLANLIGAPFNGFLAEKVARNLGVEPPPEAETRIIPQMLNDVKQEIRKLLYFLARAALLGIASLLLIWIPGVNAIVPVLWFLFGAWMLALEYSDFHLANQGYRWNAERELLQRHRWAAMGFGATAAGATLVPIVNFLVMPAAVAGATAMWVEILKDSPGSGD